MNQNTIRVCNAILKVFQTTGVIVGTGITVVNLINIPNPKNDTITMKLVGLSVMKGAVYAAGATMAELNIFAISGIVGMLINNPQDVHFIPGSRYCTSLRQEALNKKE